MEEEKMDDIKTSLAGNCDDGWSNWIWIIIAIVVIIFLFNGGFNFGNNKDCCC